MTVSVRHYPYNQCLHAVFFLSSLAAHMWLHIYVTVMVVSLWLHVAYTIINLVNSLSICLCHRVMVIQIMNNPVYGMLILCGSLPVNL